MAVITTNLIQGPAELWVAPAGSTEPQRTLAGMSADPPSPWTSIGGTTDGVNITIGQEFARLSVDQIVDEVGARLTARTFSVETKMAEGTLENLAIAMNAGTIDDSAADVRSLEPVDSSAATQPIYKALCIDGWAPVGADGLPKRRRIIVRKVLSTDDAEFAYNKEDMTVLSVTLSGFYVSKTSKPWTITDVKAG